MEFSELRDQNSYEAAKALVAEVEKVVVGKHHEIVLLVTALLAGGHVLIEDVPGVGKTTLAAALAGSAGLSFRRAQFTPDVMASDITGFSMYNRAKESFEFREGLVMCNILLADEINRASPKTQSSLLEAMEEGRVTVDGKTYDLPQPFLVIATENPSGYVGTYPLPEAQLDRFAMRISMGYPTEEEEIRIVSDRAAGNPVAKLKTVTGVESINAMRASVSRVRVAPEITQYIVRLVQKTRDGARFALGASPRASLALMRLSRALALLSGRDYVIPEDISSLFLPALSHRLVLSQEMRMSHARVEDVLGEILREVEPPIRAARPEEKK